MKVYLPILLFLILLSYGCDRISNGGDVRKTWERCEKIFNEPCSIVAIPDSSFEKIQTFLEIIKPVESGDE